MEAGTQTDLAAAAEPPAAVLAVVVPPAVDEPKRPGTAGQAKPATPAPGNSGRPQTSSRPATASRSRLATPSAERQRAKSAAAAPQPPQQPEQRPATATDKLLPARPKTAAATGTALVDKTPMVLSFNPDPRLRSWQRLEHMRLHKIGLSSKLSRRYNVSRRPDFRPVGSHLPEPPRPGVWLPSLQQEDQQLGFYSEFARRKNEVAPFRTFQKPTCGAFFTRETDNRKIKHNLEPTDLIKWRYFL